MVLMVRQDLGWPTCMRHNVDAVSERIRGSLGMPEALGVGAATNAVLAAWARGTARSS